MGIRVDVGSCAELRVRRSERRRDGSDGVWSRIIVFSMIVLISGILWRLKVSRH